MTQPVDSVVFGQRRVPEGRAPEANIAIVGLRRDGELDLLRVRAVGDGPMPACDRRDGPRQVEMPSLQPPDAAGQPHGEAVIGDR
jgi:hypothetical protein